MAAINGVTAGAASGKGRAEDGLTQSLEQVIKKKLKDTARQLKKKAEENPAGNIALLQQPRPELFSKPTTLIGSALKTLGINQQSQRNAEKAAGEGGRLSAFSANTHDGSRSSSGISAAKTDDISVQNLAQHSATREVTLLSPTDSIRSLAERQSTPLLPSDVLSRRELQELRSAAIRGRNENPSANAATAAQLETTLEGMPPEEGNRHDRERTGFIGAVGDQFRMTNGEKALRSAETTNTDPSRQAQRPDQAIARLLNSAPAETTEGSKLTYRFTDWGEGRQVNIQLGGHNKTPHVLQPSDTLVHQRLTDSEGQPQGEKEWVFSDDQEQQKHARQYQQADEDNE